MMRPLYLKMPASSRAAPEPSAGWWMTSSLAPSTMSKASWRMYCSAHVQSGSSSRPPMSQRPSSSMGLPVMSSEVRLLLNLIACVITGPPSELLRRSSFSMLHVSERSTSTTSGPTAESVSWLEPRWRLCRKPHRPARSVSKSLLPPRSPSRRRSRRGRAATRGARGGGARGCCRPRSRRYGSSLILWIVAFFDAPRMAPDDAARVAVARMRVPSASSSPTRQVDVSTPCAR